MTYLYKNFSCMTEKDFIPLRYTNVLASGTCSWESPSNIALVKYWGKKQDQIPENPSISFTLTNCKTITTVHFSKKENNNEFSFEVFLDNEKKDGLNRKSKPFLSVLKCIFLF